MSLIASAHSYAKSAFPSFYSEDMGDVKVIDMLESIYSGGWSEFKRDYYQTTGESPALVSTEKKAQKLETLLQQRAKAERLMSRHIRLEVLEEIVSITCSETSVKVVIQTKKVRQLQRRWVTEKSGTKLVEYWLNPLTRDWKGIPHRMTIWDEEPVHEETVLYGAVATPERVRDALDWAGLCWRPGTSATPLDGESVRNQADAAYLKNFGLGEL